MLKLISVALVSSVCVGALVAIRLGAFGSYEYTYMESCKIVIGEVHKTRLGFVDYISYKVAHRRDVFEPVGSITTRHMICILPTSHMEGFDLRDDFVGSDKPTAKYIPRKKHEYDED